jgi:DNA primase
MSVVDDIKSKLDIVQYVSRTTPLKRAGRTFKACCPFHSERTPSFVVDPGKQTWRCFGACATGGDVFAFAMRQNGWTFQEAVQELGKLAGVEVRQRSPLQRAEDEQRDRVRGLLKLAAEHYHECLLDAADPAAQSTLAYAHEKRGLTDETIQKFMIGFAPEGWRNLLDMCQALGYSEDDLLDAGLAIRNDNGRVYDRFRNRLMIPIRDERGRVVGFGARALKAEDNPKYLNSPQSMVFDKSKLLFALDQAGANIRQSETAVIVEGYLDAIQAHQAGYTNVVAQMGTALTETQLKLIAPRWAKKIVLALDSDAAGQSATMRSLEVARETLHSDFSGKLSVDIRILTVPDAKDPDDLIRAQPQAWAELVERAVPVADYVIAVETGALPPNASLQERSAVARRLLPILLASENDLYKMDNLQRLAVKLRIAERDLLAWASEQQSIDAAKTPRPAPPAPPAAPAAPPNYDDMLSMPEPPNFPPLDDEFFSFAPSDDLPDFDTPIMPAAAIKAVPITTGENTLERDCLRALIMQPDLIYHVNRKFRELAQEQPQLQTSGLRELDVDDFSHPIYHPLARVLQESFGQDDHEPLDYMRRTLTEDLRASLEFILLGDLEHVRTRLQFGLSVDLETVRMNAHRSPLGVVDPVVDVIEKGLRLRRARLVRERQELVFLQMEAQTDENSEFNEQNLSQYIILSALAQRLIEVALKEQSRLPQ